MNYRPHHTAISVRNLDQSLRFYEILGYKQVHRYDESNGSMSIVHIKLGDSFLEIFGYQKNQDKPPVNYANGNNLDDIGVKHMALWTDDIKAALVDLKSKGLADENTKIIDGKTKISFFFIQDPDGVWIEFVQDKRHY